MSYPSLMEIGVDGLDDFGDAMYSRRDTERKEQEKKNTACRLLDLFWLRQDTWFGPDGF